MKTTGVPVTWPELGLFYRRASVFIFWPLA